MNSAPICSPFFTSAGFDPKPEKILAVTPLIRERIKLLRDAVTAADFFFRRPNWPRTTRPT